MEDAIQAEKRQGGARQKTLFDNDAGMSKSEMAAFYLDNANDTLEVTEDPRRLTKDERQFQRRLDQAEHHKLKYYANEYTQIKQELQVKFDKLGEKREVAIWVAGQKAQVDADYEAKRSTKDQMTKLKIQGLVTHTADEIAKKQAVRAELTQEIKKQAKEETKLAKKFKPVNESQSEYSSVMSDTEFDKFYNQTAYLGMAHLEKDGIKEWKELNGLLRERKRKELKEAKRHEGSHVENGELDKRKATMMARNGLEYEAPAARNPTQFTELSEVLQEEAEVESEAESGERKDLKEALPIGLANETFSSFSYSAKSRRSQSQESKALQKKETRIAALRRLATKDRRGDGAMCEKCQQAMGRGET